MVGIRFWYLYNCITRPVLVNSRTLLTRRNRTRPKGIGPIQSLSFENLGTMSDIPERGTVPLDSPGSWVDSDCDREESRAFIA